MIANVRQVLSQYTSRSTSSIPYTTPIITIYPQCYIANHYLAAHIVALKVLL